MISNNYLISRPIGNCNKRENERSTIKLRWSEFERLKALVLVLCFLKLNLYRLAAAFWHLFAFATGLFLFAMDVYVL